MADCWVAGDWVAILAMAERDQAGACLPRAGRVGRLEGAVEGQVFALEIPHLRAAVRGRGVAEVIVQVRERGRVLGQVGPWERENGEWVLAGEGLPLPVGWVVVERRGIQAQRAQRELLGRSPLLAYPPAQLATQPLPHRVARLTPPLRWGEDLMRAIGAGAIATKPEPAGMTPHVVPLSQAIAPTRTPTDSSVPMFVCPDWLRKTQQMTTSERHTPKIRFLPYF